MRHPSDILSQARLGPAHRLVPNAVSPLAGGQLVTILGVTYSHLKPEQGGDLYLTRFGIQLEEQLRLENWYEREWFKANRERLDGTSAVFRVRTKPVDGRTVNLVVKNCRVGEDVPVDTRTLEDALNAEFNSPWEEFSLVMEMREGAFGPRSFSLSTQRPLAIYVPPESLQLWQSGRSREKMQRIQARHPGIELDILRQYKLVYEWIPGMDVVQLLLAAGLPRDELIEEIKALNLQAMAHMRAKGWIVADMKPQHVIVRQLHASELLEPASADRCAVDETVRGLRWHLGAHEYAVIDYELLGRTEEYEAMSRTLRRKNYIEELGHRDESHDLPEHLSRNDVLEVPYVTGQVESTGGELWIVGKNPRLFDFFLPERWRRTALWRLARDVEISYTVTKDGVNLLWTPSRAGERVPSSPGQRGSAYHYQDPFTVFSTLRELGARGIPVVDPRAIYVTGTTRLEQLEDDAVFGAERMPRRVSGAPLLRRDRNYVMLFAFFPWIGSRSVEQMKQAPVPRPMGLEVAIEQGRVAAAEARFLLEELRVQIQDAGYHASVLSYDDLLVGLEPDDTVERTASGLPLVRLHDAELLAKLDPSR